MGTVDSRLQLIFAAKNLASGEVNRLHGSLGKLHGAAGKLAGGLKSAAGAVANLAKNAVILGGIGLAAVGAGLFKATQKASDLGESMSKVNVVFGKNATSIVDWSKTSARALGISQQQALEAAGTFGNLFSAMKIAAPVGTKMSKSIVGLASDLASFNNASPEDVLEALRAGLVGETEPLRKFGINLTDARLRQEALRLGLVKNTKETLPAAAKAQAAYSLILKDTTLAQGDFARTSGGMANQQRILAAVVDNAMAKIGNAIIPVATTVLPLLATGVEVVAGFITDKLIPGVQDWVAKNQPLIRQIGDFASGVLSTLISVVGKVVGALAGGKGGPGLIATAMTLGRQIFTYVVPKVQAFITTLTKKGGVIDSIMGVVGPILEKLIPAFGSVVKALFGGEKQRGLVPALGDLVGTLWGNGKGPLAIALKAAGELLGGFMTVLGNVAGFVADVVDGISDVTAAVLALLKVTSSPGKVKGKYTGTTAGGGSASVARHRGGPTLPGGLFSFAENGSSESYMLPSGRGYVLPDGGAAARQRGDDVGTVAPIIQVFLGGRQVHGALERVEYYDLANQAPTIGRP
jgi:hypothetical protein